MNQLAADTFDGLVKKTRRLKVQPDWSDRLMDQDKQWAKVSKNVIKALDEMKGHGSSRPLAPLQEYAFEQSLVSDDPAVHTVALWLTDTRLRVDTLAHAEGYEKSYQRRRLVNRGLMK